jgi:hypothetical protein
MTTAVCVRSIQPGMGELMRTIFAQSPRYECFLDPSELYVIWDNLADVPCMVDGDILAFPTQARALAALDLLNRSGAADAFGDTGPTRGSLQ